MLPNLARNVPNWIKILPNLTGMVIELDFDKHLTQLICTQGIILLREKPPDIIIIYINQIQPKIKEPTQNTNKKETFLSNNI